MATLTIQSDVIASKEFQLEKPEITIGRLEDSDIVIEHGSVSGHHAILVKSGEDYILKDNNSTNGTTVNGTKITEQLLRSGDIIHFGYIQTKYASASGAGAVALPDPTAGRELNFATQSVVPSNFTNLSPFGKKTEDESSKPLDIANMVLGALAACALAFALFRMFA
jgi:predicted component of type VI protein secretion system